MSYYILPKNINDIIISPKLTNDQLKTYISHSLYNYYNKCIINMQTINNQNDITDDYLTIKNVIKIINPYEYIFSQVPGTNYSVSKLKSKTNLFYDIFEIFLSLNLFENYINSDIRSMIISKNHYDIEYYFQIMRENHNDKNDIFKNKDFNLLNNNIKYDFIYYENISQNVNNLNDVFNTLNYDNNDIINLIKLLMFIIKCQKNNGFLILKLNTIFHKPYVDIIYILSFMYDKVFIIKPNTSNIISFDKYIICKNYLFSNEDNSKDNILMIDKLYIKMESFVNLFNSLINDINLNSIKNINIEYLLQDNIPYYFLNRLDEINIILGQQQLESIDNIINIIKNKNKDDKLEFIKKTNIQKSINWCEKYKIPCNKFIDKTNIFLNNKNKDEDKL